MPTEPERTARQRSDFRSDQRSFVSRSGGFLLVWIDIALSNFIAILQTPGFALLRRRGRWKDLHGNFEDPEANRRSSSRLGVLKGGPNPLSPRGI